MRPGRPRPSPEVPLEELRQHPVVAVDVNHGHLAAAVVAPDGNIVGVPVTIPLDLAGRPAATRDGRLRAAITTLITIAEEHGARAIVIEDLDFVRGTVPGPRTGRHPALSRPARQGLPPRRPEHPRSKAPRPPRADGRQRRSARHRRRSCLHLPVGSPALARPAEGAPPRSDRPPRGSRRDRPARARAPGQAPREREPHRPGGRGAASPDADPDHPGARIRTKETRRPTRLPAAIWRQDRQASPDHGGQPGSPRPFGAAG